jgi:hypothetical protein
MKLQEFKDNYYCTVNARNQDTNTLVVTTEVRQRSNDSVIDKVNTTFDISDMNSKIADSQTMISLMPFDWEKVSDHTKRAHLDYVAQRAPIENYFPMNSEVDISDMYV